MRNRCGDGSTMATSARSATSLVLKLARLGLVAVAACVLLAVGATAAVAKPSHKEADRFGLFTDSSAAGLAVQQSSGEVYVLDRGATQRVLHFGADGSFIGQFGPGASPDAASAAYNAIASDDANDEILLADPSNGGDRLNGAVDRFSDTGTFISQIDEANVPAGSFQPNGNFSPVVAVNPSNGNVYVAHNGASNACDPSDPVAPPGVYVFDSSGTLVTNITGTGTDGQLSCPAGVAVDGAGNVYVLDSSVVRKFTALGTYDSTPYADGGASNLAVNQTSGDLYVVEGNRVIQFDSSGTRVDAFGGNVLAGPSAIAVQASNDRVLVTDSGNVIAFDPFEAPDVTTDQATGVTDTEATLQGIINPQGPDIFSNFEWGTDTSYGNSTGFNLIGSGTDPLPAFPETLTGLTPNTTYHFRVVGTGFDNIPYPGNDQTFTTDTIEPTIAGEASTTHSTTTEVTAKLSGTINPNNAPTTYRFEWGKTTSYGNSVPLAGDPAGDAGAGTTPTAVSADLANLEPGAEYHWRITADNGTDSVNGTDQKFTAPALVPEITIDPASLSVSNITKTSAIVKANVNTKGEPGTFHVTATSGSFVGTSALIDVPDVNGPQTVSATVEGLPTGATINVRASIFTENGGSAQTDAVSFDTLPFDPYIPPPVVPDPGYGCNAPHLNNYSKTAKRGKTITLTGSDLGIGGVVTFGSTEADSGTWTSGSIQVDVPSNAKGTAKVTANCGKASNTINVKIAKKKVTCKKGYKKKQVKGKTKCVKKKKAKKKK